MRAERKAIIKTIRIDGKDSEELVYSLLPNGKCSNCGHQVIIIEKGWITWSSGPRKSYKGIENYSKCKRCKHYLLEK